MPVSVYDYYEFLEIPKDEDSPILKAEERSFDLDVDESAFSPRIMRPPPSSVNRQQIRPKRHYKPPRIQPAYDISQKYQSAAQLPESRFGTFKNHKNDDKPFKPSLRLIKAEPEYYKTDDPYQALMDELKTSKSTIKIQQIKPAILENDNRYYQIEDPIIVEQKTKVHNPKERYDRFKPSVPNQALYKSYESNDRPIYVSSDDSQRPRAPPPINYKRPYDSIERPDYAIPEKTPLKENKKSYKLTKEPKPYETDDLYYYDDELPVENYKSKSRPKVEKQNVEYEEPSIYDEPIYYETAEEPLDNTVPEKKYRIKYQENDNYPVYEEPVYKEPEYEYYETPELKNSPPVKKYNPKSSTNPFKKYETPDDEYRASLKRGNEYETVNEEYSPYSEQKEIYEKPKTKYTPNIKQKEVYKNRDDDFKSFSKPKSRQPSGAAKEKRQAYVSGELDANGKEVSFLLFRKNSYNQSLFYYLYRT